jgi:branched-subunit amino acid aminotransferase/4-amino-4-deoxychorismate lyase
LCRLIDIEVIETKILPGDLSQFESAFLAGTMIEIKPINQINQLFFDSYNTVFNLICNKFKEYIYELEI